MKKNIFLGFFLVLLFCNSIKSQTQELIFDSIYQVDNGAPEIEGFYTFSLVDCVKDSQSVYIHTLDSCDQFRLEKLTAGSWQTIITTGCVGVAQSGLNGLLNPQGPLVFTGLIYPDSIDQNGQVLSWQNCNEFSAQDNTKFQSTLGLGAPNWGSGIIRWLGNSGDYRLVIKNNPKSETDWWFVMQKPSNGDCGQPPATETDTGCIYVPTAFSPNDDGINDVFTIFAGDNCVTKVKSFHVFDRWGEEVFRNFDFPANDFGYGWDGTFRDKLMDIAVFVWFAEVEFTDGTTKIFKGGITLVK